jgi:hypothetical protein
LSFDENAPVGRLRGLEKSDWLDEIERNLNLAVTSSGGLRPRPLYREELVAAPLEMSD